MKGTTTRVRTEHEEQREVVSWFRQTFRPVRIFAVPNGEQRSKTTGARLKVEGVSAGVPDLYIPAWNVWIEMKRTQGGVVSGVQSDWHDYLRSVGHTVLVCYGAADAKEQINRLTPPSPYAPIQPPSGAPGLPSR